MKVQTEFVGYYSKQDSYGNVTSSSLQKTLNRIGYENVLQILPLGDAGSPCYTIIYKSEVTDNE